MPTIALAFDEGGRINDISPASVEIYPQQIATTPPRAAKIMILSRTRSETRMLPEAAGIRQRGLGHLGRNGGHRIARKCL